MKQDPTAAKQFHNSTANLRDAKFCESFRNKTKHSQALPHGATEPQPQGGGFFHARTTTKLPLRRGDQLTQGL
ncbi:MAG: hypothetical protein DWI28_01910, partial [Planctomycetota bacterium]